MAFRARIDSDGKLVDCEIFTSCRSKYTLCKPRPYHAHSENESNALLRLRSRTFVKLYDSDSSSSASSPKTACNTVRYVNKSMSFSELNSYTETETSTLRCTSPKSASTMRSVPEMETETETLVCPSGLCQALSPSSSQHSMNTCTSSSSVSAEAELFELSEQQRSSDEPDTSSDKQSTTSICSWEAELEGKTDSEKLVVPPLQLEGCENDAQLYGLEYDQLKLERPVAEAYENWLSAKRKQLSYKQQAEREQRELQQQQAAWRQQQAEERYRLWCERKAQCAANTPSIQQELPTQRRPQSSRVAKLQRMQLWEEQKMKQAEARRKELQRKQLQQEAEKAARKLKAEQAWQQWMRNVAQRPKPVPLNQGMNTLRGTISNLYMNPNEWVSLLDD